MPELDAFDPFDVDALLSDQERLVQQSVRRFVTERAAPIVGRCFAEQRFPVELVPDMARLGLLGATLQGYGCAGLNNVSYGLICQELERGDSSLRSFVSVQSSLVMSCIERFGSPEQKSHWLPQLASGRAIGCFGLTEAHGGSDPAGMRTVATRESSGWRINGAKSWITNGSIAHVAVVWARVEERIGAFLIERGTPGFEAREIRDKLSMRASDTADLFFADARVPEAHRLGEARGLGAALACLDQARFGIVWGAVGAAQACVAEVLEYASSRELFGRPLAHTQLVQARLADAVRRIAAAQCLALRLAQLKDRGAASTARISLAKWNNVRMALDVARDCRDLLGAAGITVAHSPMRHMLNLESVVTYEGTESIHQLVVGRALTGASAF